VVYLRKKIIIISLVLALLIVSSAVALFVRTSNADFKNDPDFYKALGNEMAKRGETDKAIPVYETGLSYGEDEDMRNNLAVLYYRSGEYNKAIAHLRALIALSPENPSYHYDLAINLVDRFRNTDEKSMADLDEALLQYEKANELSQGYLHSVENIAVLKKVLKK
jgi:tetratricopeptide (TPR) repeat protein